MNYWESILRAVQNPFSLIALIILVTMVILRMSLAKVPTLSGKSGYKSTIYVVTVVGTLALIISLATIGLRFYEVYIESTKQLQRLTRVEVEAILQSNRGNIERCLSRLSKRYFFFDFIFTQGSDGATNVDIIPGLEASPEIEFLHPSLRKKEVENYDGHETLRIISAYSNEKLSVVAPDVNGCIVGTIKSDLIQYTLKDWNDGFIHRYITDIQTE